MSHDAHTYFRTHGTVFIIVVFEEFFVAHAVEKSKQTVFDQISLSQ